MAYTGGVLHKKTSGMHYGIPDVFRRSGIQVILQNTQTTQRSHESNYRQYACHIPSSFINIKKHFTFLLSLANIII